MQQLNRKSTGMMNDQTSDYSEKFLNLTTNLIHSLYPLNKIAKILYLAPRKHDETNHDCSNTNQISPISSKSSHQNLNILSPKSMYSALQNFLLPTMSATTTTTTAKPANRRATQQNNIQPRINPFTDKRPRLPHVTQSDLLNINQIHAASLNGIAGQFAQNNNQIMPQIQPQLVDNNNNQQVGEQQSRKPSQSNSVSQFALPPAPAVLPAPVVELNPGSSQGTQQQFRLRPTSAASNLPGVSASSQPSTTNLNPTAPTNNRQQSQQVSSAAQTNKFPFMANQASSTSTTLPSSTSTTSAGANLPPQIGTYESSPSAATNAISVHSNSINNQANQQSINSLLSPSPSTTSTTTTTTMASNIPSSFQTSSSGSGSGNQNNHHNGVLPSFSPPIRSHNTLASAKYSLDGIIAVAIFGGFIFLGAIITIIVIIIRR